MKVLCLYSHCGPSFVRNGWRRVFEALGHKWAWWNPQEKSAFDAFSENEPDLFIGTTYDTDRAVVKCIARRPQMRVIMFGSAWGQLVGLVDREKYPIQVVTDTEKQTIEWLKKASGRPDFVFIHVTDKFLEPTMGGWSTIGVKPVGILNAADTFAYCPQQLGMSKNATKYELESDVSFIGGYWPYKARNLDRYMLPLCQESYGLKVKIWGNQPWPVHQFLGQCSDADTPHIFVSAKVCPSVSEPHSTDLGFDVIERPFKVLAAGGFCVSDYVEEARDLFTEEELPMGRSPKEFIRMVRDFVKDPDSRLPFMAAGRRKVLMEHTYLDRVAQMFGELELHHERAKVLALKGKLLGGQL